LDSPLLAVKAALLGLPKGKGAVYKHYFNSQLPTKKLDFL